MENATMESESAHLDPRCVARTPVGSLAVHHEKAAGNEYDTTAKKTFFRSAEWSADGTTIITTSSDNSICTFILPPDLLEDREEPLSILPYSTVSSSEPVNAVINYPLFSLQEPSTTLVLSSVRDHPTRLNSALVPNLVASYPLINPMTEAFITPHSLLFRKDGTRFISGSDSLISTFDVSRSGQAPVSSLQTASKKDHFLTSPGMKMKGIISALAVEEESGVLAAGTFTRHVGLYDSGGIGECLGVFTVEGTEADKAIKGGGITHLAWSACGRYLYIVERKSDGAMIYDIRQTGQLVAWLEGRKALTNQRLGVDLLLTGDGHNVWGGGTDGIVRVWKNPHQQEGAVKAGLEWPAHDDVVSSAVLHPSGGVAATSSGHRHHDPDSRVDCRLKIWAL